MKKNFKKIKEKKNKSKSIIFISKSDYNLYNGESPNGIVTNMMECDIIVSKSKLKLHNYINFQINTLEKGINPYYFFPLYKLKNTTIVLLQG